MQKCKECREEEGCRRYPLTRLQALAPWLWLFGTLTVLMGSWEGCAALGGLWAEHKVGSWQEQMATILALFITFSAIGVVWNGGVALARIVTFFRWNVIGQQYFAFRDRAGCVHGHDWRPVLHGCTGEGVIANIDAYQAAQRSTDAAVRERADQHLVDGPIFQIRRGGWFRRCRVIADAKHPHYTWWKIRTWDGCTIAVTDYGSLALLGISVADALDIIRNRECIDAVVGASTERDELIRGIVEMRTILSRSPETIGRTKHAKVLRHLIERMLGRLSRFGQDPWVFKLITHDAWVDDVAIIREALGKDWQPPMRRA